MAVLRFAQRVGKPGDWSWDEPEVVNGFRPPVPPGGMIFVAGVPPLIRTASSSASFPITGHNADFEIFVQDALMEALLDSGADLGLNSDEWVTVIATDDQVAARGTAPRYTLYLSAKGSDLARVREQEVSREEARKLVVVLRDHTWRQE